MSYKKKVHKAIQDLYIQTKPLRIGRAVMMDEKLKAGIAGMLFTLIAGIVIYVVMDNWETITTFTLDYQMPIWGQILLVAISVITTNLGTWHFSKRRKEQ
jgi:multisubunit Na+/H+ antiporter MnhB subunit